MVRNNACINKLKLEKEAKIVKELELRGIRVPYGGALKVSGIRISTHFYNIDSETELSLSELKS